MIQDTYKNNVTSTNGDIVTTGFNIEVNESMFQLLTSNVYNDPKLAVMREWSTNACDACIAADKEVKFDVHLPTIEEPHFSVRDYGTGLSPDDITGLFSNLGASTKRDSNKYNGTLGIGRMAGLAVADAFTVESYYEGQQYSYVISIQNGVPVTMSLGTKSTTQPDGLKLSVAVDLNDIGSYVDKTHRLYKFFDYKPTLNIDSISTEMDVSEHISDDWFIENVSGYSHSSSNYVVMSQVAYEIPYNNDIKTRGFRNLVVKVPPGAVTFNPGRESLSLNKKTVEYINSTFKKVEAEYVEAANTAMALANNDKELMGIYTSLTNSVSSNITDSIDPVPFTSTEYQNLFTSTGYGYYTQSSSPSFRFVSGTDNFKSATNNMLSIHYKNSYYKTSRVLDDSNYESYNNFFNANHVIVDVKTKYKAALNEHFSNRSLVTWQRSGKVDIDEAVEKAKEYLDTLGISYTMASDIASKYNSSEVKAYNPREGFYASVITTDIISSGDAMSEEDCLSQTYLYLKLKNTTPILSSEDYTFRTYMEVYQALKNVTVMPKIRGVAKKYQSYADDWDNWVDFETFIKDRVKNTVFRTQANITPIHLSHHFISPTTVSRYPKDIQDLYREIKEHQAYNNHKSFIYSSHLYDILKEMGASFESYSPENPLDIDRIEQTFPETLHLLREKSWGYSGLGADFVPKLAKLEEFYALHSTK